MILVYTFVATIGFALLFQLRGLIIFVAAGVGTLGWGCYMLMDYFFHSPTISNFTAAALVTIISELVGIWRKRSISSVLVPALIPLVPGSQIYYTMEYAVHKDFIRSSSFGFETLAIAAAITAGVLVASAGISLSKKPKEIKRLPMGE